MTKGETYYYNDSIDSLNLTVTTELATQRMQGHTPRPSCIGEGFFASNHLTIKPKEKG